MQVPPVLVRWYQSQTWLGQSLWIWQARQSPVHGGTVMKWIDEAGYACATSWSKRYCVTVFLGSIRFHRPIMIGDLVEVEARLAFTRKGRGA